jgi:hypothetical protein
MPAEDLEEPFAMVFGSLSSYGPQEYHELFVSRLPEMLLGTAASRSGELADLIGGSGLLDDPGISSRSHWRNPELYPHLMSLQSCDSTSAKRHLALLRVHLGMAPPSRSIIGKQDFLRLQGEPPRVLTIRNARLADISQVTSVPLGQWSCAVYAPYTGLFTDVAGGFYHASPYVGPVGGLANLVREAADILAGYSARLYQSVAEHTGVIAFTSDDPIVTQSFSMRTSYLGAVFSAICDPVALGENLIHEHYHCRLWAWWLVERPEDLPSDELVIQSPITGMARPIIVMMQALLIYVALLGYYRYLRADSAARGLAGARIGSRLELLEKQTPILGRCLDEALKDRPASRRFVTALCDLLPASG